MLWESPNSSREWSTPKGNKTSERPSWVSNYNQFQHVCCRKYLESTSCNPNKLPLMILLGAQTVCSSCTLPKLRKRRHQLLLEENITCFMKKASKISILTLSENPTKVPNIRQSQILFHHTRTPVKLEISCTYSLSSLPHFEPGQDTLLLEDALTPTSTQTQTGTVQTH